VRDEQDAHPDPVPHRDQQLEDLRLDRHVQRGRRLVGDEDLRLARERHRDHHALAHPTGELVRIGVHPPPRVGDPDHLEHLDGTRGGRPPAAAAVAPHRLADLVPDGERGVQARHRLLEDHGDLVAAHVAQRPLVQGREVAILEPDASPRPPARRGRDQAEDGQPGHGLAGAGLADEPDDLAFGHRERHVAHDVGPAVVGREVDAEAVDVQQRAHVSPPSGSRGRARRAGRRRRG
jgi:hypothetical protein